MRCRLLAARLLSGGALALTILSSAGAEDAGASCQAPGWDMGRELKVFGGQPRGVAAGSAIGDTPALQVDQLYALRLLPQTDVKFLQPPEKPTKAAMPFAGLAHFTAVTGGLYRITVDAPLWIDLAASTGILASSAFNGWHQCSLFRKSVEYALQAGQSMTLQFSGAAGAMVKVAIEPRP